MLFSQIFSFSPHFFYTSFLSENAISSLEDGVEGKGVGSLDPPIIPSSSPSFTGSKIFDFYQILYFFFLKLRIFLVKRFRATYTAGYINNELLLLLLFTGVLHLVPFRDPSLELPPSAFLSLIDNHVSTVFFLPSRTQIASG